MSDDSTHPQSAQGQEVGPIPAESSWPTLFAFILSLSLIISGFFYLRSHERLDYANLDDGELTHAKVPTLRGDYRDFYAQVRDAIEGRAIPPVTPEQALRLMYTLELCVESSRKRAPLPWAFSA